MTISVSECLAPRKVISVVSVQLNRGCWATQIACLIRDSVMPNWTSGSAPRP